MITQTPNSTTNDFTLCTPASTTTTVCVPCIHPFKYLFELAKEGTNGIANQYTFEEVVDRLLDKGVVLTNCKLCCPGCNDMYSFASVETQLKFLEAVGYTVSCDVNNPDPCCSNVYASVETYLKYEEAITSKLYECCNGFTECVDELECLITTNAIDSSLAIERLLDKGVAEFGNFVNNCTGGTTGSDVCYLAELIKEYLPNHGADYATFVDRLLDKGITIGCVDGTVMIGSTETALKYFEALGLTCVAIPALPNSITTTTTLIN
jgi:hypothetical protein